MARNYQEKTYYQKTLSSTRKISIRDRTTLHFFVISSLAHTTIIQDYLLNDTVR
jgi:hypothetical protein